MSDQHALARKHLEALMAEAQTANVPRDVAGRVLARGPELARCCERASLHSGQSRPRYRFRVHATLNSAPPDRGRIAWVGDQVVAALDLARSQTIARSELFVVADAQAQLGAALDAS